MFKLRLLITAILMLVVFSSSADACPNCKDAVAEQQNHIVDGYFWSILFMMSMPFALLTFWTIAIWRWRRTLRNQLEAVQAAAGAFVSNAHSQST